MKLAGKFAGDLIGVVGKVFEIIRVTVKFSNLHCLTKYGFSRVRKIRITESCLR